jgi:hypothetical protein
MIRHCAVPSSRIFCWPDFSNRCLGWTGSPPQVVGRTFGRRFHGSPAEGSTPRPGWWGRCMMDSRWGLRAAKAFSRPPGVWSPPPGLESRSLFTSPICRRQHISGCKQWAILPFVLPLSPADSLVMPIPEAGQSLRTDGLDFSRRPLGHHGVCVQPRAPGVRGVFFEAS